jgi:tetratricopeptide (TPR) repeat protein
LLAWACTAPVLTAAPPALADAINLFAERRYAEAQPLFETILQTDARNTQVLLHLGKLAAKRGEREQAVDYLRQAVEIAPQNPELQFEYGAASCLYAGSLGMSFKALGAVRRGRDAMEKAVEMEPRNLVFRQGLLEFYSSAPALVGGGMKKAHAQAEAIAAIDPDQGGFARANLHRVDGNHPAAMASLAAILERAPDNYFALYLLGRCAAESGEQLERGLTTLRRCLELPAPDKGAPPAYVWWRIGQIHLRQGDLAAARTALEKAQTLAPHETRIAAEITALPSN